MLHECQDYNNVVWIHCPWRMAPNDVDLAPLPLEKLSRAAEYVHLLDNKEWTISELNIFGKCTCMILSGPPQVEPCWL